MVIGDHQMNTTKVKKKKTESVKTFLSLEM